MDELRGEDVVLENRAEVNLAACTRQINIIEFVNLIMFLSE